MNHRNALTGGFAAALLAALAPQSAQARAGSVDEAKAAAPPLTLTKPAPEVFELDNGIRVWFLEQRRLPLVTVRAVIRTGDIWEPAEQQGVADLTGRMLRVGGTATRSADEVDDELDFLAAQVSSNVGTQQGNATLDVLTDNLDPALALFADLLRNPAFDPAKLEVQKNLIKEEIRRQNDDPIQVAFREYSQLLWGKDHPRARVPSEAAVDALTRDQILAFHANFYQPGNILLGVAGDISRKDIRKKLNQAFGDWKPGTTAFPEVPPAPEVAAQVALAAKGVPQSTVVLGHLGPREDDPHRASGEVMMSILGSGGFTSYIVDRVRNDEGLAYFAGGFLQFGMMDRGAVITLALSKSETTCRSADLILEQIDRIRTQDVTDVELRRAVDGILNSQAFDYDSSEEVVQNLMNLVYYDLPADHDEKVIEAIGKVTQADVKEAANAILQPDALSIIAVGDPEAMDCGLDKYAEQLGVELRRIDLD
jgi:predicted Zn-dependent peptidase